MNSLINFKNLKLHKSVKYQFYIFSFILIATLIYSFFYAIPSHSGGAIGIGSPILQIGDRSFYIDKYLDLGYPKEVNGSFLYPFILKLITRFLILFEFDYTSRLWNFIVISISSLLSLLSLLLIDRIAFGVFGYRVAVIANWLFIFCPYTIFYSINGSLTMYILFFTTLTTFIVIKSSIYINKNQEGISPINTFAYLSIALILLSSLRPTGAIFSLVLMSFLIINIFSRKDKNLYNKFRNKFIYLIISFVIFYSIFQIFLTYKYLLFSLNSFTNENGQFFGVDRNLIKERLNIKNGEIINSLKLNIYWLVWKITEFVSGMSDIRDSHNGINGSPLLPFILRTFTGIFIIYPINLFAFFGLILNWGRIFNSGLIWIFFSLIICISPSLLGVAFTTYIYMFYTPIIIISASCIEKLIPYKEDS